MVGPVGHVAPVWLALATSLAGGVGAIVACQAAAVPPARVVEAGFWFEPVAFTSPMLGSPLDAAELDAIQATARREIVAAFEGWRLEVTDRRTARYRVRVVQDLRDPRFRRRVHVAGQSRGIAGFGGSGEVSFEFLATGALALGAVTMNANKH